jgi:hypothetical protein
MANCTPMGIIGIAFPVLALGLCLHLHPLGPGYLRRTIHHSPLIRTTTVHDFYPFVIILTGQPSHTPLLYPFCLGFISLSLFFKAGRLWGYPPW